MPGTRYGRRLDGNPHFLYVDDALLTGRNDGNLEMLKGKQMTRFKMPNIGEVSQVLGMQVTP